MPGGGGADRSTGSMVLGTLAELARIVLEEVGHYGAMHVAYAKCWLLEYSFPVDRNLRRRKGYTESSKNRVCGVALSALRGGFCLDDR
jgi:hypothetical protein